MDFTGKKLEDEETEMESSYSCARVNSIVIKQEQSKCHLKVRRVRNDTGPQIKPNYLKTLDKLMSNANPAAVNIKQESDVVTSSSKNATLQNSLSETINERVTNAEQFLKLSPNSSKNFFQRLKALEDRILYLESLSPEYVNFLSSDSASKVSFIKQQTTKIKKRKVFSVEELNEILARKQQLLERDNESNSSPSTEKT